MRSARILRDAARLSQTSLREAAESPHLHNISTRPSAPPKELSAEKFASLEPVDRIRAIYDMHGDKAVQLSSMQKTAGVIMHLIHRANVNIPILFFDTQYLHQETHDVKNQFQEQYGLNIRTVKPDLTVPQQDTVHGKDLWKTKSGQALCCYMRKEKPLLDILTELDVEATLAGLMRTEGGARKDIKPVATDPRNQNQNYFPIFDFNNQKIHDYIDEHKLPVHALYAQNFLSIGCAPCTTPVLPGENSRAGRWRHLRTAEGDSNAYCGMNYTDLTPPVAGTRTPLGKKALFKRKKPAEASTNGTNGTPTSTATARLNGDSDGEKSQMGANGL